MTRRFDPEYQERLTLDDGRRVELRLLQHADADLLQRGFDRLSDRSKYQRFCSPKPRLSDSELQYFTEVDGERHFAIGAVETKNGTELGLGVARFVRFDDRPEVAEPAIVVVDAAQGVGLGNALMRRLFAAAEERGIERFEFLTLAGNEPVERMIEALPAAAVERLDDGYVRVDVAQAMASAPASLGAAPATL